MPFAIGSETWGSIQFPAAFCGVTGLRPTYGRVSRHGAMALSWTMDKLGPLARTAEDCGLVLAAIAGPDPDDSDHDPRAVAARATGTRRRFRFGMLKGTLDKTQPEVRRNFEASLAMLREMGDVVEDLELPDLPYDAMAGRHHRGRGGERVRAALRERADHQAHRAGRPHRRLRGPGGAGQGLSAGASAPPPGGGGAACAC